MKVQTGIWLDSSMAIIVHLFEDKEEVHVLESHLENEKRLQEKTGGRGSANYYQYLSEKTREGDRIRLEQMHFFEAIMEKLSDCQIISIFGPDPTKQGLKHFLEETPEFHHKAISVQPLGMLPEERFVWFIRKYYQQVWV